MFKNSGTNLNKNVVFVLAAETASGVGLVAVSLKLGTTKGFRPAAKLSPELRLKIWQRAGLVEARKVERIEASWVHGRGLNADLDKFVAAKIVILGCGSIGSQVAMRLAQLGVGSLILVDGEVLNAANVGRHALGMAYIGLSKANSLAKEIAGRFPHIREVLGIPRPWQTLVAGEMAKLTDADLIVSCMGDWAAEGLLNDWHRQQNCRPPIIYGWLDEGGTAAHALSLSTGPCLACVLDEDGKLRVPETNWSDGGRLQSEPACGALYQPYGPTDVLAAETLICNLAIDILTGRSVVVEHRIHATSTARLKELGGTWSAEHKNVRPKGMDGAFEFTRPVEPYIGCLVYGGGS